jgi:hypothetical protein
VVFSAHRSFRHFGGVHPAWSSGKCENLGTVESFRMRMHWFHALGRDDGRFHTYQHANRSSAHRHEDQKGQRDTINETMTWDLFSEGRGSIPGRGSMRGFVRRCLPMASGSE